VLGLADQVGSDVRGVSPGVGQDRDLGRPGLRVDARDASHRPLCRRHVDVPGAGDDVHRLTQHRPVHRLGAVRTVGEHRDRLGTADGVHLVDLEQRARREDGRVRQPVVVLLGRARDGERRHPGLLGRDDVHHDARGVDGQSPRHVQTDPADRHPALADLRARREVDGEVQRALRGVHLAHPHDRLLEPGPDRGVQGDESVRERRAGDPERARAYVVKALGQVSERSGAACAHVLDDRLDLPEGRLDVQLCARQSGGQLAGGKRPAAQVDTGYHEAKSSASDAAAAGRCGLAAGFSAATRFRH
jgi:hypothetical protein